MRPDFHRLIASSRRLIVPVGHTTRDRNANIPLTSRADVVTALERPTKFTYEISFVVTDTFVHEDFDIAHRSVRTREEEANEIVSLAHSPELKLTFIGLTSGDILFFQHDFLGQPLKNVSVERLREHSGAVHCLQFVLSTEAEAFRGFPSTGFAAEGNDVVDPWLLSGSADRTIKIWSVCGTVVECIRTLGGHGGTVVSLSLCMPYLVSSSTDGIIFFWNVEVSRRGCPTFNLIQKLQNGVLSSASAPKGQTLFSHSWFESVTARWAGDKVRVCAGSTDGSLILLEGGGSMGVQDSDDSDVGEIGDVRVIGGGRGGFIVLRKMQMHNLCTRQVYALPLESVVVTTGSDAGIAVVDPFMGQVWWKQTSSQGVAFSALAWDPKQSLLLAGDDSGTLSYFNIYSNERIASQRLCNGKLVHISVDLEAGKIIVASNHSIIVVRAKSTTKSLNLTGHEGSVSHLYWMPAADMHMLLSIATDETFRLWDIERAFTVTTIPCKHTEVTSFTFLPGLDALLTGHENGSVRCWQLLNDYSAPVLDKKGKLLHENTVACMESWPDILDPPKDERTSSGAMPQTKVNSKSFKVLTGGYDGSICVLSVNEIEDRIVTRQLGIYKGQGNEDLEVLFLAVSCPNRIFFSAGNGKDIKKYEMDDPTIITQLSGHTDSITALKIVDGQLLSGSLDRTVRLWKLDNGECLHVLTHLDKPPFCILALSPTPGNKTDWVSVSREGSISFWKGTTLRKTVELNLPIASATEAVEHDILLAGTEDGKILSVPLPM